MWTRGRVVGDGQGHDGVRRPGTTRGDGRRAGLLGAAVLTLGLVRLDPVDTVAGLLLLLTAKAWYIDRQVLLYEDMKARHEPYAAWEY